MVLAHEERWRLECPVLPKLPVQELSIRAGIGLVDTGLQALLWPDKKNRTQNQPRPAYCVCAQNYGTAGGPGGPRLSADI